MRVIYYLWGGQRYNLTLGLMLCRSTGSSASSDSLGHLLLSKVLPASTSALLLPLPSFLSWLESKLKCKPIWLHRIGCNAIPLTSFSSVQLLSRVQLVTPWIAAHQAFLSITNSGSLLKLMFIESVMPSNHLIICHPFSCLQSFSASGSFQMNQFFASGCRSVGASASASALPMNAQDWFPLGWTSWISLQSKGLLRVFSNKRVQKHQFFGTQLFLWSNSHIRTWLQEKP